MSNTQHTRPRQGNPAKAEATGDDATVEFRGYTYRIPPSSKWSLDAVEAAELGNIVSASRMLLGDKQWAKFRKRNSTLGDLEAFMDAVKAVSGGNR